MSDSDKPPQTPDSPLTEPPPPPKAQRPGASDPASGIGDSMEECGGPTEVMTQDRVTELLKRAEDLLEERRAFASRPPALSTEAQADSDEGPEFETGGSPRESTMEHREIPLPANQKPPMASMVTRVVPVPESPPEGQPGIDPADTVSPPSPAVLRNDPQADVVTRIAPMPAPDPLETESEKTVVVAAPETGALEAPSVVPVPTATPPRPSVSAPAATPPRPSVPAPAATPPRTSVPAPAATPPRPSVPAPTVPVPRPSIPPPTAGPVASPTPPTFHGESPESTQDYPGSGYLSGGLYMPQAVPKEPYAAGPQTLRQKAQVLQQKAIAPLTSARSQLSNLRFPTYIQRLGRRTRWLIAGGALAVVLLLTVLIVSSGDPSSPQSGELAPRATAPAESSNASSSSPRLEGIPHQQRTNESAEDPGTPVPDTVLIYLHGTPAGSEVKVNGKVSRLPLRLQKSSKVLTVTVSAEGYKKWRRRIVPDRERHLPVRMTPEKKK